MSERRKALICDLDGTLSSCEWRRPLAEAKAWREFHDRLGADAPVPAVAALLRALAPGVAVVLTTGRGEGHRRPTEWWLMEHGVAYDALFMRGRTDFRADAECKHDILHQSIEPRFDPVYAVDDRPQIVQVWREHGIPTLAVQDPGIPPRLP